MKIFCVCLLLALCWSISKQNSIRRIQTSDSEHIVGTDGNTPAIWNGERAKVGQLPYVVDIVTFHKNIKEEHNSGVLISSTCVLTSAAVCLYPKPATFKIYAGYINLAANENGCRQIRDVKNVLPHADYDPVEIINNICLLTVKEPFNITTACVKPACVATANPPQQNNYIETQQTAAGFGATGDNDISNKFLYYTTLTVKENIVCGEYYSYESPPSELCVSGNATNTSFCLSDFGLPLAHKTNDGKHCAIGVGSFISADSCEDGSPVGFTYLPYFYTSWIKKYCKNVACTCS